MDENLFEMSIDDINSHKTINLAKDYNFKTIDDDIAKTNKSKSSYASNEISSDEVNENNTDVK